MVHCFNPIYAVSKLDKLLATILTLSKMPASDIYKLTDVCVSNHYQLLMNINFKYE